MGPICSGCCTVCSVAIRLGCEHVNFLDVKHCFADDALEAGLAIWTPSPTFLSDPSIMCHRQSTEKHSRVPKLWFVSIN